MQLDMRTFTIGIGSSYGGWKSHNMLSVDNILLSVEPGKPVV